MGDNFVIRRDEKDGSCLWKALDLRYAANLVWKRSFFFSSCCSKNQFLAPEAKFDVETYFLSLWKRIFFSLILC
jgi:hypothetical protein